MARLEVITSGAMRSGKTEEVLKRMKKPGLKGKKILVVKPKEDTREVREIFSKIHDDKYLHGYKHIFMCAINNAPEELKNAIIQYEPDVLIVDEAQFLGLWLIDSIRELLDINDKNDEFVIIVSGLDKDYLQSPWGPIPLLMVHADEVKKLSAACEKCEKRPAPLTFKKGGNPNLQKEVGEDIYEARCRACHKQD